LTFPIKKWAAAAALAAAAFYLLLSGCDVATQRSFFMTAVVLIAVMVDRRAVTFGRTSIVQLMSRPFNNPEQGMLIGWWTRCLNFVPYDQALAEARRRSPGAIPFISHRSLVDGPRVADVIQQSLIGRVIGVYETAQETLKIAGGEQ
jgi:hypothetical protein